MEDINKLLKSIEEEILNTPLQCVSKDEKTREFVQKYLDENKVEINTEILKKMKELYI